MKLSELTAEIAAQHIRTDPDDALLQEYLDAARNHVLSHTGLTIDAADEKPELTMAALILAADLYNNREATTDASSINPVLKSFLDSHRINFL